MKKIVRLTENDLTRIVKKVINEQGDEIEIPQPEINNSTPFIPMPNQLPVDKTLSMIIPFLVQIGNMSKFKIGVKLLLSLNNKEYSEAVFKYFDVPPLDLPDGRNKQSQKGYSFYLYKAIVDKMDETLT
jgi:hypothetical protein